MAQPPAPDDVGLAAKLFTAAGAVIAMFGGWIYRGTHGRIKAAEIKIDKLADQNVLEHNATQQQIQHLGETLHQVHVDLLEKIHHDQQWDEHHRKS